MSKDSAAGDGGSYNSAAERDLFFLLSLLS